MQQQSIIIFHITLTNKQTWLSTAPNNVIWLGKNYGADPSGRAVQGVGPRPLAHQDCGLKSHRGHGRPSPASAVRRQAEVPATSRPPAQRSPTECGAIP